MKNNGFTLIELLISLVILLLALMAFFTVNQATSSRSMGAYYKYMAFSLGKEVIDYSHGMGYKWAVLHKNSTRTKPFPLSKDGISGWHSISDNFIFSKNFKGTTIDQNDAYFAECEMFERKIEFKEVKIVKKDTYRGMRVIVELRMKKGSRVAKFMRQNSLTFSSTIMEQKP